MIKVRKAVERMSARRLKKVRGVERMSGAPVMASDLRASAALVMLMTAPGLALFYGGWKVLHPGPFTAAVVIAGMAMYIGCSRNCVR